MVSLVNKLNDSIQKLSAYYHNGKFVNCQDGNNARIIIISALDVLERKSFFKILKSRDLKPAIRIFEQKSAPFKEYFSWYTTHKASDGFFVVVYYIKRDLYDRLRLMQKNGGLLLPEQAVVRRSKNIFIGDVEGHGSYEENVNYISQFSRPNTNLLQQLTKSTYSQTDLNAFSQNLINNLNVSVIFEFLSAYHNGHKEHFKLTLGHISLAIVAPVIYLAATSGFLFLKSEATKNSYDENKKLLADYKRLERRLVANTQYLASLNAPYKDYLYSYEVFDILNDLDVFVNVQAFSINSSEITINGISDNAGEVFKILSNNPRLTELRYVRPVRKSGKRDSFTIGFKLATS